YMQYADKDCGTDYFYADYLFRAGKYQESLNKAIEMSNSNCKNFERLPILFAYNYDRLGDSINAKKFIDQFFATTNTADIEATDYELAVKVFSKFEGVENQTVAFLQKAIDNDSKKENKLKYTKMAADIYGKAKMYKEHVQWLHKYNDLKGSMGEYDYYVITNSSFQSKDYVGTMVLAQKYIAAFPNKPQGYAYNVAAAKALDTSSTICFAEPAILQYNDFLLKDSTTNKSQIVSNYYYIMIYYADKIKDYSKALEYCNKILLIIPDDKEMLDIKKVLEERAAKSPKSTK
ncbi:MAG TPA: hypothetical protein PKG56_08720, partial [Chitinophagaceae bacterium]|nr:hypothetical protein [Chitinophagaceae bacterium]